MKVSIVDDSIYVRELLKDLLAEVPGVQIVSESKNALEAMATIRARKPDVVILDLELFGGSGLGVLGSIKKELPSVIVIVLSGYADVAHEQVCLQLGADHVLRKEDGFKQLVELCRGLVVAHFSSPSSPAAPKQPADEQGV